jgi:hypothetical protein
LLNKSWPIGKSKTGEKGNGGFFKTYFVEAVLPVRFNRPSVGASTNPVTFGLHFGVGF